MAGTDMCSTDLLARRLRDAGCRFAFGMPGGEVLTLIQSLENAGITFFLTKHENCAGFMAEGVHHIDRAPGILVTTLGPGAMNCVNVVANAYQDRVPLIVLTGQIDADEALTYCHQVVDHKAIFTPITKGSFLLTPAGADTIADRAIALSMRPRQGPIHIDVPMRDANSTAIPLINRRQECISPTVPSGSNLNLARQWLSQSVQPIALIGLDVLHDRSAEVVQEFIENFTIPFITTYKAKGVIDEQHPLGLGAAGLSPLADSHLVPLFQKADLVIGIGYDPIEMRVGWRSIWDPSKQNVIDITAVPNDHYMHHAGLNFVAHTGATLQAMMSANVNPVRWPNGDIDDVRGALKESFPTDDRWGPAAVIAEAGMTLPKDTLATVDSGAHRILLSQMWTSCEPKGLVQSTAFCTMGSAIPLAMGLKLAAPERPVVAFSGDAGFLMVAGELSTCAELSLPIIFVVFVDASLALIELKQRQGQFSQCGVNFGRHDVAAIGRAFGGFGVTVQDRVELRCQIEQALQRDRFTVIGANLEPGGYDERI